MLTHDELVAILDSPESERLERKESASSEPEFGRAVCALANDLGSTEITGKLIYGQCDDGSASDAACDDSVQTKLANWARSGKILPSPAVSIEHQVRDTHEYLIVRITPSNYPPVYYDGRIFVRVGPSTRVATPQEEQVLIERRRALALSADLLPITAAGSDDLDLDFFRKEYLPLVFSQEVLDENQRPINQQLRALRVMNVDSIPTLAGVLLLAVDPRQFVPGGYVHFRRLEGEDLTSATQDSKEISGPLPQLLQSLSDTVEINIKTALSIDESGKEERHPDYPKSALMQFLINAVFHRSYENTNSPVRLNWFADRIEISNPGGPFGQVTVENFGSGVTDYRNPVIGEILKNLGWVQRFGYGIQEAKRALAENGNPEPEFEIQPMHILVKVRARS